MKILVGYDGSNSAKDALALAKKHAAAFDGKVIIVSSLTGGSVTHAVEVEQTAENLEVAKKLFDDDGIPCETKLLVRGMTPGEDIVDYAKEKAIDEIIIGIKRRSRWANCFSGLTPNISSLKPPARSSPLNKVIIAGLTGGIASGKSTISRFIADAGARIIDADQIAREVVKQGTPAYDDIVAFFGQTIILPDGEINRKRLGEIIFNDPEKKSTPRCHCPSTGL